MIPSQEYGPDGRIRPPRTVAPQPLPPIPPPSGSTPPPVGMPPPSSTPPPILPPKMDAQRPGGPGTWNENDATRDPNITPDGVRLTDGPMPPPTAITPPTPPPGAAATALGAFGYTPTQPGAATPPPQFRPLNAGLNQLLPAPGAAPSFERGPDYAGGGMPPIPGYTPGAGVGAPSVNAAQASANMFDMASFRPFSDAVMAENRRHLDPRFAAEDADFRQRMVNQGITEGSKAFDNAYANFVRSKNDAYSSASNQALLQALGAQNQMFGQSFQNAGLRQQADLANAAHAMQASALNQADRQFGANLGLQAAGLQQADRQFGAQLGQRNSELANAFGLQRAQLGEGQRQFDAGFGMQQGQFNANLAARNNELANAFAMQRAQFGEGQRQFDAGFGAQQNQFGANFGFQNQRADMQDLMALLGYGQQADQYNNQLLAQDQQRAGALFGLIPGLTPTQLDVMGPANSYLNAQAQANAAAANRSNGFFGALGQLGSAFMGMPRVGG